MTQALHIHVTLWFHDAVYSSDFNLVRFMTHWTRTASLIVCKVPAGVDDGDQIRLAGEGQGSASGATGDLYVQIRTRQHPIFSRDGDNLYCEMPISVAMATLGGEIEIPTLNGRAQLKIPAESQSERVFRLRGKGVKNVRSGDIGDLYCKVKIETPVNLSKKQKEALRTFDDLLKAGGDRHSPRESSWSDRLKNFFTAP